VEARTIINEPATAHERVRALADAVRNNELTTEARSAMVALLLTVDAAARLVPKVLEHYPDCDAAAVGYLTGNWQPVATAYADLLVTITRPSGEGNAA
jgi:hypothetical protein